MLQRYWFIAFRARTNVYLLVLVRALIAFSNSNSINLSILSVSILILRHLQNFIRKKKQVGPGWPGYNDGPPGPLIFIEKPARPGPLVLSGRAALGRAGQSGRAAPGRAIGPGCPFRPLIYITLININVYVS